MKKNEFGEKLLQLRKENKLNQSELAKALGCITGTISKYELGIRVPDIEFLEKVARYFNVSADYLLGLSPSKTTQTDIKQACDYTGLSQEAIEEIKSLSPNSHIDYNQKDFFSFWCESKYISEIMYDLTMLAYIKEVMLTEAKGKLNNTLDESYYKDMTKKYQLYITAGNKLNNKFNEISENTIKKFVIKEMNIDENEYRELNQIVDEYVNSPDSIKSSVFKEIEKLLGKEDDKK